MLTKLKSGAKVLLFTRLTNKRELKCSFSFLFLYKNKGEAFMTPPFCNNESLLFIFTSPPYSR